MSTTQTTETAPEFAMLGDTLLRDYFAGIVLNKIFSHFQYSSHALDDIANRSYDMADAMLKARAKSQLQ